MNIITVFPFLFQIQLHVYVSFSVVLGVRKNSATSLHYDTLFAIIFIFSFMHVKSNLQALHCQTILASVFSCRCDSIYGIKLHFFKLPFIPLHCKFR